MDGPRRRVRAWLARSFLVALLVAVGCSDGEEAASTTVASASTTAAVTSAGPTAMTTASTEALPPVGGPFAPGRTQLPGFGEVEVRIVPGPDGEPIVICVLLAETPEQRQRGLMGVTDPDLGGYDGMLFTFPDDSAGGFYMKDTPLPLSIAYLDAEGAVVDTEDMEPCLDRGDACPTYPPSGPYRTTLEVAQGGLDELGLTVGSDARLEVVGPCRAPL